MALQLTNIIRDVASDLERGRTYLPTEDLVRFGVTEEALRLGKVTPPVRSLLEFECARARDYYRQATVSLPPADARSLVAAEIMGGIYFEILERIERAGYDVFRERIRVPRPYRALIASGPDRSCRDREPGRDRHRRRLCRAECRHRAG
jgi:phytoene synthase